MKRKSTVRDLERRAYHEAGHVVAQYRSGIKTRCARISSDKECQGQTAFQLPHSLDLHDDSSATQSYIDACVMSTFAGGAAEKRVAGIVDWDGLYSDLQSAVQIGAFGLRRNTSGREFMAYLGVMERQAKRLIDAPENWRLVQVVARALLKDKFIWGKRVRQIIERELKSRGKRTIA